MIDFFGAGYPSALRDAASARWCRIRAHSARPLVHVGRAACRSGREKYRQHGATVVLEGFIARLFYVAIATAARQMDRSSFH